MPVIAPGRHGAPRRPALCSSVQGTPFNRSESIADLHPLPAQPCPEAPHAGPASGGILQNISAAAQTHCSTPASPSAPTRRKAGWQDGMWPHKSHTSQVTLPKKVSDSPYASRYQKLFRGHPRTAQLFLRDKKDSTPSHPSLCQAHLWPGLASLSDPIQANPHPRRDRAAMQVLSSCMENFSMIWAWLGVEESTGLSWGAP